MLATNSNFAGKVIAWHALHGRHDLPWQRTRDPYRIWVSEIMLQQTQVGAVAGYFLRFMDRFPDVQTLARASEDEVLRLWSGLGYYARARNLHKAAREVVAKHRGQFPRTAQMLLELPGVGRSTAAAVAAFAFGERGAILDGNVKRVLARCFGVEGFPGVAAVEASLWKLAASLLPVHGGAEGIEAYTQGLMDLGATVCTRSRPICSSCPLAADCVALETAMVNKLPTPRPKKAVPLRSATWLVLRLGEQVLLERKPSTGLWGGLWVFPEFSGEEVSPYCRAEFSCELLDHQALAPFAHGFTHFKLNISPVLCEVGARLPHAESSTRVWLDLPEAIAAAVPVPVRRILRQLRRDQ